MSYARHISDNSLSVNALHKSKPVSHPEFVFDDFQTRQHKAALSSEYQRVYVLVIRNIGSFCPVLNIKNANGFSGQILFDTFTDIRPMGTVEIHLLADESTRIGIHEFELSLRFFDNSKSIFISKFALQDSEFSISRPQCIKRKGIIPKLLSLLSIS